MSEPAPRTAAFNRYARDQAGLRSILDDFTPSEVTDDQAESVLLGDAWEQMDDRMRDVWLRLYARRSQSEVFCQMAFARQVDSFQTYLVELLALVFQRHPGTMGEDKQVRVGDILPYETRGELIVFLAEQQVQSVSISGSKAMLDYFRQRLKFPMFESRDEDTYFREIVEVRNAIVHHRGRVSQIMLAYLPGYGPLGSSIHTDYEKASTAGDWLEQQARQLDHRAIDKWKLPTSKELSLDLL